MSAGVRGAAISALSLEGGDGLEQHVVEWRRLASAALEPNPFYEPALMLPALRSLRGETKVEVVLSERVGIAPVVGEKFVDDAH